MEWTRRAFLQTGLGSAASLALAAPGSASPQVTTDAPPIPPAQAAPPIDAAMRRLYERTISIDTLSPDGPELNAEKALAAGLGAAVVDIRLFPRNFIGAIDQMADWNDAFRGAESKLFRVLRAADFAEAKRQKRFGVALACQDAQILDASTGSVNDFNLRNLRFFHDLGLRVLQLTHNERNGLGDSFREKSNAGLSRLGEKVVAEMNRLGMLVDLSHVSDETMRAVLEISEAPVIFSHSSARALVDHPRNVPDDVLRRVAANGGVVMVNFATGYDSEPLRRWNADLDAEKARLNSPPFGGLYIGQPERAAAALKEWQQAHPAPVATLKDVADHLDHLQPERLPQAGPGEPVVAEPGAAVDLDRHQAAAAAADALVRPPVAEIGRTPQPQRVRGHAEHDVVAQQRHHGRHVVALERVHVARQHGAGIGVGRVLQGGAVPVQAGQRGAGPLQRAVDRGGRGVEQLGDLGGLPAQHLAQDQRTALAGGQVLQRGDEGEADRLAGHRLVRRISTGVDHRAVDDGLHERVIR